jgi:translation initiation factor IF-3
MEDSTVVKVYDENDVLLGAMTLLEAKDAADAAQKDVVLRNEKTDPPIVKILNYKKELLKRLFKKLGRDKQEGEVKTKQIKLTTTISFHDLENKRKQAQKLLKTHQVLKLYMKVNIYDQENVAKGRMMLLNLAEDLKEDCRIVVAPVQSRQGDSQDGKAGAKKPQSLE